MVSPSKFEPETHCGGASGDGEDQSILKFVELGAIKLASTDLPACRITSGLGPLAEVKRRRLAEIDKVEREVRARLTREINYGDARAARLREEERAGKEQRINAANAEATAQRMVEWLHKRQSELDRERQITALAPVLKGAALVIPHGLVQSLVPSLGFAETPNRVQPGRPCVTGRSRGIGRLVSTGTGAASLFAAEL